MILNITPGSASPGLYGPRSRPSLASLASGSGVASSSPRQTEALLPTQLSPAGQGAGKQEVSGTGQDQASRLAEEIRQMAEKANAYLKRADTHLEFRVNNQTGHVVVDVVDNTSQEVVRQIPPETMVRFAERMTQMKGLLFDTSG